MRIAVLGANGQLGSDLVPALAGHEVLPFTEADFDVRDGEAARRVLGAARPDVIVNTTAFHKVEECEKQPDLSFAMNATAPLALALLARELGARFVHYSTDYVYGGHDIRPLTEAVPPSPLNVYGASKAAGEWLVLRNHPEALVIRSSGLFGVAGAAGKGGNFIQTVLRLAREQGRMRMVNDQRFSPSYTYDLARGIRALVERGATGLVHLTNGGWCSWYELAAFTVKAAGLSAVVDACTTADIGSPVRRPSYSVLENERLGGLGVEPLRPWREAVTHYLAAKGVVAA